MGKFADFRKHLKRTLPEPIIKIIRLGWDPFYKLYFIISELFNSKLCTKMFVGWKRADWIYNISFDYVRHSSLELVSREIYENNIAGSVAELGVFRGDFAKYINRSFPDRKLYLFDTFEGFSAADIATEEKAGLHVPDYDNLTYTSVKLVLEKMKYKENCIVKKGYFPETAQGIDDKFAFVNIDVDLSEPIYNGLCFFYHRLEKGGYIFVHDYNEKICTGAKAGIKKFSMEHGIPYFPLSDRSGSVVIMK